ncbi:sigma-70 family RNA polymerase sigma factor [Nakamurella endophytica]|uniref:RNA polymerase sigma factor n=1 Tax=Nakamurella endophytica TaxID=1748367 RepID=A0A917T6N0_9ACTN|nr:sigma-70 family RNA polymerase sigma factor [Nakamurella endophytica]GGM11294.1 RNA polymerase sigma factor [Nakamurella endophytica]
MTRSAGAPADHPVPLSRDGFETATAPYRAELLRHCYRMSGSLHDAEDLLQETLLRAWRAGDRYDPAQASVRTWLYRIATNVCLTALAGAGRRVLPSGLVPAGDDPDAALAVGTEVPWLTPLPDGAPADPADLAVRRESVRLAFVAALQLLPARQRAVLLLRDVLGWPAADVAGLLEVSVPAVTSALQRARARLRSAGGTPVRHPDPAERAVLERYVDAFQRADLATLVGLLHRDVVLEMPPVPLWFRGVEHYRRFLARVFRMRGTSWRAAPVAANGQPAFATWAPDGGGGLLAHSLQLLEVRDGRVTRTVVFADPTLFPAFGLPQRPAGASGPPADGRDRSTRAPTDRAAIDR